MLVMKKFAPLLVALMLLIAGSTMMGGVVVSAERAAAQVTPLDDDTTDAPGLGSIVGSPDAGPSPDDAGDRGGAAQLGVALGLLAALCFIGFQIWRSARRGTRPT